MVFAVQTMWQDIQTVQHPVHPSIDSQRHSAVSLSVLRQTLPPEVRHEEAHLYSHG